MEVTVVEVTGVGRVEFPKDLTTEEIEQHIKKGISTSPNSVQAIATGLVENRAKRAAAISAARNRLAHANNPSIWFVAISGWFAFVVGLYLGGWAVAWIRRGFIAT